MNTRGINTNEQKPKEDSAKVELWESKKKGYIQAVEQIIKRRDNPDYIPNLRTPWDKINDQTLGGLAWNTLNIFAGRPGSGKTLIKDQILRYANDHLPNVRVLEFQLEMSGEQHALRDISSYMKIPIKKLLSYKIDDGDKLSDSDIQKIKQRIEYVGNRPWNLVTTSGTVSQIERVILEYRNRYPKEKLLIAIDHSDLVQNDNRQNKLDKAYALCEMITRLNTNSEIGDIMFIVLSQMNRGIEETSRMEPGKIGNYPTANDIFGADAFQQHAHFVVCFNRPRLSHIDFYGPEKFFIPKETKEEATVVWHIVKNRTGSLGMIFFKAFWNQMEMYVDKDFYEDLGPAEKEDTTSVKSTTLSTKQVRTK